MRTMESSAFIEELWGIIAEELSHQRDKNRMMHALFNGELERDRMKLWAKQLYLLTRTGPRFLSSIHANCDNFEVASWLVQNLYEEYGEMSEGRDHPSLCRNFGRALGMSVEELEAGPILDCTRRFIDYAFAVTRTKEQAVRICLGAASDRACLARALGELAGLLAAAPEPYLSVV